MISRDSVIQQAIDNCFKEIYKYVQPSVTWEDFKNQYKEWSDKHKENISEPQPYEFYYLSSDILKVIVDNYVYAYDLESPLPDIIEILKDYCKEPIIDKYINEHTDENGNYHPGHRGYDHPDNLEKQVEKILGEWLLNDTNSDEIAKEIQDKFFEFLDMANEFFVWNRDVQKFSVSVYLGVSPNSNKEAVIENWKKYRNQDIEIKEITKEEFEDEYYG